MLVYLRHLILGDTPLLKKITDDVMIFFYIITDLFLMKHEPSVKKENVNGYKKKQLSYAEDNQNNISKAPRFFHCNIGIIELSYKNCPRLSSVISNTELKILQLFQTQTMLRYQM